MLDPVKAFLSLIMLATRLQVLNCSSRFARLAVARGLSSGAASYSYGAPTTSATTGTSITRGVWRGRGIFSIFTFLYVLMHNVVIFIWFIYDITFCAL